MTGHEQVVDDIYSLKPEAFNRLYFGAIRIFRGMRAVSLPGRSQFPLSWRVWAKVASWLQLPVSHSHSCISSRHYFISDALPWSRLRICTFHVAAVVVLNE